MFSRPRTALLVSLIIAIALGWLVTAHYTAETYIGLDDSAYPAGFIGRLLLISGLSVAGALISAFVVNPITFGMLGYEIGNLPMRTLFQDVLYFVLLYLVWSLLYLQLIGKSLGSAPAVPGTMEPINVTKGNQVFKLDPANISCIKASGDYVEFCTSAESYLKSGTISFYERALENGPFVRIHRSFIVNRDKIVSVAGPTKGQYWIKMQDGQELRSSRRYREVVESLTPPAP